MIDDTADAIILRWPKAQQAASPPARKTIRQRLDLLAFPLWLVRLSVECLGWVAVVGLITQL
jgi:hypothetical protein